MSKFHTDIYAPRYNRPFAVSGVPGAAEDSAYQAVKAAIEIYRFFQTAEGLRKCFF